MIEKQPDTSKVVSYALRPDERRQYSIGIVDVNPKWINLTGRVLRRAGYRVALGRDGFDALNLVSKGHLGLLILGDRLAGIMDPEKVVTRIKEFTLLPPIMVVSEDDPDYHYKMLHQLRADTYVRREHFVDGNFVVASVDALVRRVNLYSESIRPAVFTNGELTIDPSHHLVMLGGEEVYLTPREYQMLALLASKVGRTVLREEILFKVWGPRCEGNNHIVHMCITHLRRKLGENPESPQYIVNHFGFGYLMPDLNHSE